MSDTTTYPTSHPDHPDFRSREFLLDHALRTMTFYHPHCMDLAGSFYPFYKDDGTIYDRKSPHLVSSTCFVFNYAMAYKHFGLDEYRGGVRHGIEYLREFHRDPQTGGDAWTYVDAQRPRRYRRHQSLLRPRVCRAGLCEGAGSGLRRSAGVP